MSVKQIAIFVKSAKNNNFCVAGFDIDTKNWSRPVSDDDKINGAVTFDDSIYLNGEEVHETKIFDVVEIEVAKDFSDNPIQPENFFYVKGSRWKKIGETTLQNVLKWRGFDEREEIFFSSDRAILPAQIELQERRESLLLLPVKNFFVSVEVKDHKKFYANFDYNGKQYKRFSVGDIELRRQFETHEPGEYFFADDVTVVCSLTNPFREDNLCYKMVAQVFT